MISEEKIIVALDTPDPRMLNNLFESLKGHNIWVKVGMELFYSLGTAPIFEAKNNGFKVFLDLKLHDIPNTVGQSMKALLNLPVDMINIHAAGGSEMMKRASEAVKAHPESPLLIAVTQLTSTSQEKMNREQNIQGSLLENVLHFAKLAKECGCDGVVSSPLEVESIKAKCGKEFITVTPGIRLTGSESQDQKRITTPAEAIKLGTDYMVIGRPITGDKDPKAALNRILQG